MKSNDETKLRSLAAKQTNEVLDVEETKELIRLSAIKARELEAARSEREKHNRRENCLDSA
jgi:hypothetical protein